ncbi:hypothetical protein [Prescottella equi]|uniref:hypothetical protein n=1 Tax=Rhodococcus hoagii TaxID=43767 RepID=UPI000A1071B3|nr:hypothetical protein [Prescottella equi]ORL11623.1 hypothetical protein A6I85_17030 [Prescottella equi]
MSTMFLNVAKLRAAAESGIEHAKSRQIEWDKLVDAAEAEWERAWREVTLPKWKALRDEITKALRNGGKIRADAVPMRKVGYSDKAPDTYRKFNRGTRMSKYSNVEWVADHEYGPRPVLDIQAFEMLIEFLDAVDADKVSQAQLEKAGFRNLSKLFTAAANGFWA